MERPGLLLVVDPRAGAFCWWHTEPAPPPLAALHTSFVFALAAANLKEADSWPPATPTHVLLFQS